MATVEALLTAEEFWLLPDIGQPLELVRGRIVPMIVQGFRHGLTCSKVARIVGNFVEERDLGRLVLNNSGVVTERDPDTVRGADVAFYSFARLPREVIPQGYASIAPDLVFEVRSPSDRGREVLAKVVEYLRAGVSIVCVLNPIPQTIHVYYADEHPERIFTADDELVLPEVLGDFRVPVRRFFE